MTFSEFTGSIHSPDGIDEMTIRALLLPVALIGLFVASDSPVLSELPLAPAPREKAKSWSKLLVGTWRTLEIDGRKFPREWDLSVEFSNDGKYTFRINTPKNIREVYVGTYKLIGDIIRFTKPNGADGPEKIWEVTIEALSEDGLTTVAGRPKERERMIFKRVPPKK